ncbi:hypothetical protein GEV33_008320 [Tenebrio molitor]|uniref:Uncharacterized protein n=1 Tax=Tenebrio molitor TaxID=7067 RepID=A0A8J6HGV9_TENMO|nr:hypothetical protein GEV33_008320 [Tenebrio molitor]
MGGQYNYRDALSHNGIRTRSLVCSPRYGGNQKNPSRAEIRGLGRRPPSWRLCRKSRAANHVRGVRDPQSSLKADCRSPWRLSSGAASLRGRRGARKLPCRLPLPLPFTVVEKPLVVQRDRGVVRVRLPLPYREGVPESPPSIYRGATPFSGKGSFFRVVIARSHIVPLDIVLQGDSSPYRSLGRSFARSIVSRVAVPTSFVWVIARPNYR